MGDLAMNRKIASELLNTSKEYSIVVSDKKKILVVDDEAMIRRILTTRLSMVGYEVVAAADGKEALEIFTSEDPDLVVLDVMLPKLDGYGVCQEIRETSDIPIIMLTALGDVADRITGLKLGADDYLVKPFSPKELEARIEAILRRIDRPNLSGSGLVCAGRLQIDFNKRQVTLNEERIRLTNLEFNLLKLLVTRAGEVISRSEILQQIWGYSPRQQADVRVVDVHISRLRVKLKEDPKNPEFIHTDRGTGYFFQKVTELPQVLGA